MKILLVAPQSRDTILGTIGNHCKRNLIKLGYDIETFDFRQSQYFQSTGGSFFKKMIKRIYPTNQWRNLTHSIEKERMNQNLLEKIGDWRPDILFVIMGDTITADTLGAIKKRNIVTVNWFHDTVLAPERRDFVKTVSQYYDFFFTIDSPDVLKYNEITSKYVKTVPLACDPEVHKSLNLTEEEERKYRSKVSFIGTVKYDRAKTLHFLNDFDLGIWGYWLEKDPLLTKYYRGMHVFGEEAVKIYNASDIVLDMNEGNENKNFYVTPRVFEVPASGAFILTNDNPCLYSLYEVGKEIICYKDGKELKELVKYYLDHPEERKEIAKRGQEKVCREHTYEKRLEQILSIVEKNG